MILSSLFGVKERRGGNKMAVARGYNVGSHRFKSKKEVELVPITSRLNGMKTFSNDFNIRFAKCYLQNNIFFMIFILLFVS